ncbi:DUF3899 domain-containing protein [Liquorilactobacillus oeni]|uniref:DUF3899 domain-containing protein n=1 Tax=Liquorilactobacillus oeni TaxID=303241 RepID=UPI001F472DB3|nr:DUF3899 domain-containing protein [Liquorilactobacillus oeni]
MRQHYYWKPVLFCFLLGFFLFLLGIFGLNRILIADCLFILGLAGVCFTVVDILLGAHLLAGWFRHKKKGESDEEYQASKIDPKKVGRLKDGPVRFSRFGKSSLSVGMVYIIFSVLLTL